MRIVHIIPGVDPQASVALTFEHKRALESSSIAAHEFKSKDHSLAVFQVIDPSWESISIPKVKTFSTRIETVSLGPNDGIRPRLRSFLPLELVQGFDLIIFTNSDICLTRDFYSKVLHIVENGIEAGSIHRRTILGIDPRTPDALSLASKSLNWYQHPGSDCFFFPPESAKLLSDIPLYMGVPPVGTSAVVALSALNPSYSTFRSLGITFHFGDDKVWKSSPALARLTHKNTLYWFLFLVQVLRTTGRFGLSRGLRTRPVGGRTKKLTSLTTFLLAFVKLLFSLK
jgi:hypothetical protein